MHRILRPLVAAAAASAALVAQNPTCLDNVHPLRLVDSQGVEAPFVIVPNTGERVYSFATDDVYLAFDPQIPNGTYYVHVTDPIDFTSDEVLSTNDPLDRFVSVTNTGGVITLSLPFTDGSEPPGYGLGLGGVGQSLRLTPFRSSLDEPCRFKAWFGNTWDLSGGPVSPYLILGGFNAAVGQCTIRSFSSFSIGGGTAGDVAGAVFLDANGNGVRDAGEGGISGVQVQLNPGAVTQLTDATGAFRFADVGAGDFAVSVAIGDGYTSTTPTTVAVTVAGCSDASASFGLNEPSLPCNGHTVGFWRNPIGRQLVQQYGILPTLPALHIVNTCGQYVAPATLTHWRCWLQGANSWNMAYMLSAQLAAMHCNVVTGFVDPNCIVSTPTLGNITIGQLMTLAIASLAQHPYTPVWSVHRNYQKVLKNALDGANNNTNWL